MFPLLSTIVFLPMLGAIVVLLLPGKQHGLLRGVALGFAILDFIFALALMLLYSEANVSATVPITSNAANSTFQFNEFLSWIPGIGINYSLGVDGISLLLVVLASLLTAVCIAASFRIEQKVKNYMAFMLLLECGILGVFLSTNLFLFYIFWELMLIPAYLLVGTWGGERRIYAAFKFVLYTSVGSLLMLAGIIALGYYHQVATGGSYTLDLASLLGTKLDGTIQVWLLLAFSAAFVVKVPLVPFHSWLPDAYAEAPAPVTALLAGAMSKTGAYGFLRFCIPLFPQAMQNLAPYFSGLAVAGILYCALMALVQIDLKRLLGYSSISHLGVVMLGMFAFNVQGVEGSVMQMVNHGITIAALFLIVGFIEQRVGTRRLSDFGGLAARIPILATVMIIAVLSSLGLPGLNSFAGEFLALLGAFRNNIWFGALGTLVVIPAAWYMLRFFLGMMQGPLDFVGTRFIASERDLSRSPVAVAIRKNTLSDLHISEFVTVLPLLALIFYLGLQPLPLTFLLEPSVLNTLQILGNAIVR